MSSVQSSKNVWLIIDTFNVENISMYNEMLSNVNVNDMFNLYGHTPLTYALTKIRKDNLDCVKYLLFHCNADPNIPARITDDREFRRYPIEFVNSIPTNNKNWKSTYDEVTNLLIGCGSYITNPDKSKRNFPFFIPCQTLYEAKNLVHYCEKYNIDMGGRHNF